MQDNPDLVLAETYIEDLGFDRYSRETCLSCLPFFTLFFAVGVLVVLQFVNYEER
jgi:hypothetical protein